MIFLLTIPISKAQAESLNSSTIIEEIPENERTWERLFINSNIAISEWFDSASDGLDLFLAGRRVTKTKNQTRVRVENSTFSTEGASVQNNTGFNVGLNLPNVEKYWHLKFSSYDDREENRNLKTSYLRQTPREENYGASIGVFKKLGKIRASFEPRIELTDPLKVSHSIQFESVANMKGYRINPKLEFFASPTKGVGTFQRINFFFQLNKIFNLTLINEGEYQERIRTYTVNQGFSFGQTLGKKRALSYTTLFTSSNRPHYRLEATNISVGYNEVIYKRILDYQIIPNYEWARIEKFRGRWGLTLNLNLTF
ncbi:MAG: hypothetical protein ACK5W9_05250 [Bdellovibrionales bacterium]